MSTNANEAAKTPAPKTVGENMPSRRIFPNITEAAAYLTAQSELSDFETTPIAAPGMDAEGNFDSELYTDSQQVMVSVLKNARKVKAIVVAPIPSTEQLLESQAGRDWVDKILQKELNHVAVRHLRDAENVETVIDQIPTTLEGYITSGRDGGGGIMEAYDELYKLINATLGAKLPVWSKARFTKGELRKSLESKGYAAEYSPALEDYKGESLFVVALNLGINAAKRKGLDPTIFERWLTTRDQKAFNPAEQDEDELDLTDFDSLTESLLETEAEAKKEADAPAPAAEAEQAEAPAA